MMNNKRKGIFLLLFVFAACFSNSDGCSVDGVTTPLPAVINVLDIFRGNVFDRQTFDIDNIFSASFEGLNRGPYFSVTHDSANSRLLIATNNAFASYEEYETLNQIYLTVEFRCTGGTPLSRRFVFRIQDTNNNPPQFLPSNDFTYTIPTPLPPGFVITGCFEGLTVRDIDLTTNGIAFTIEENPYFEIVNNTYLPTEPKEFIGILQTTTFIRNLPEPITLRITATDDDPTGDPRLTTYGTVTIKSDAAELPEDPVFAEAFYLATYTVDHQLMLAKPISLRSGFHEQVRFNLEGDFSENFELIPSIENTVTIRIKTPLTPDVLRKNQIILVIRADRESTSGDTTTILVQLPEDVPLQFQRSHYEGTIEINQLQVSPLILTQGYEGQVVNVEIFGDYAAYFIPDIQGNTITLTLNQISDSVINKYNVISLEVAATTEFSSARTIVTLEVIKDDNVTPVFNKPIYTGSYLTETGLNLEPILIDQGYDNTVELFLDGAHTTLFEIKQEGHIVRLTTRNSIPPAIFNEQRILLTLQATKPRTVGANTAIVITLPAEVSIEFEKAHYEGTIEENTLRVPTLSLTQGYEAENLNVKVLGVYGQYFESRIQGNIVTLSMRPIPDSVIAENNMISLEVVASTDLSSGRTVVTLEIIKDDNVTPVFNKPIYTGSYLTETGLNLEPIVLDQGFDNTVELYLDGEHQTLFEIKQEGPVVRLNTRGSIPPAIFNQQRILLTLQATKSRTVGANTAIVITLPTEESIEFEKSHYRGTIEENTLKVPTLLLTQGYETEDINVMVLGDYERYFDSRIQGNTITLTMKEISDSVIAGNNIISLEVVASTEFSIARTIVTLEIIKDDNVTPVFVKPIYTGSYLIETGLDLEEIVISQGYDDTVALSLDGDHRTLFEIKPEGSVVRLTTRASIPPAIFNQQRILLTLQATKPRTVGANTAIVITLPPPADLESIEFEKAHYTGTIEENNLRVSTLILTQGYEGVVNVVALGEYAQYFKPEIQGNVVTLSLRDISDSVLADNNIISLQVMASTGFSSARTTVTLEIIKDDNVTPVFNQPIYTGSYLTEIGLTLDPIVTIQGYDETVRFSLSGDHETLFEIKPEGPIVRLTTRASIPPAIFNQQRILLTLQATKPRTVGANTAIVITLPPPADLESIEFEKAHYTGTIEENNLRVSTLILTQGYEGVVNVVALGEYAQYFKPEIQGNVVTLSLRDISDSVLADNNIISLQVMASNGFSSARTTVTLEIIKDDNVTPVFNQPIYTGSYLTEIGLTLDPIVTIQGYDETVRFSLSGEHETLFEIKPEGPIVRLTTRASIPPAIFNQQRILLTLQATKPRTVGANTAIVITLPPPADLESIEFEKAHYTGTIEENNLRVSTLILTQGYEGVVNVVALGEYAQYFKPEIQGNVVTLSLRDISDSVLADNNIISLQVMASNGFSSARTTVTLEIIKDDNVTPVFNQPIYTGSYLTEIGLILDPIVTIQGYDETVRFSLSGDHETLFEIKPEGPIVRLTTRASIPPAIFNQQRILLTLQATKPRTVGANTAIVITLPPPADLESIEFEKAHYTGTIEENNLRVSTLILTQGYEGVVNVVALGEYAQYFKPEIQGNVVTLSLRDISDSVLADNNIISLQVMASNGFSSARTTVTLEIIKDDNVTPVFNQPIYTGSYLTEIGLILDPIVTIQGYDETVRFSLSGDHETLFEIKPEGPIVRLTTRASIPPAIFNQQRILLTLQATKPRTVGANTAIVITLPPPADLESIEFEKAHYTGTIEENNLRVSTLILTQGYEGVVNVVALGEYAQYFKPEIQGNVVTLSLRDISDSVLADNNIISLQVMASNGFSSARTTVTLEIIKDDNVTPVFNQPIYTGSYLTEIGLTLDPIVTIQGYDETVRFSLSGDHETLFEIKPEGPIVRLTTRASIPPAIFNQQRILLTLQATKPRTVGANTAIVITLPPPADLESIEFEKAHYTGTIEENNLRVSTLILTQGYEGVVNVVALGEYAQYFEPEIQGNVVTLSLRDISDSVLADNNIISLQVMASNGFSSARTTVTLEIIKDDNVTPVFKQPIYTGSYLTEIGLILDPIVTIHGYDETVRFSLSGDHETLFEIKPEGPIVRLTTRASIPPAIFNQQRILLTLQATKPRTVGANTAIVITLPPPAELESIEFERVHYTGTIEKNSLRVPTLILTQGYEGVETIAVLGEYAQYFVPTIYGNAVTLTSGGISDSVLAENNIISLQVMAFTAFSSARTVVTLEIIKDDNVTPVFNQPIYTGSYLTDTGLTLDPIVMIQGYDETVKFSLNGDHETLFEIKQEGPIVWLTTRASIPPAIFNQQRILLSLQATKPRTVGANTAILITLPTDSQTEDNVSFEKLVYNGIIRLGAIQHEDVLLSEYNGVDVEVHGQYSSLFVASVADGGAVTVSASGTLTLPDETHVVLELHAADARAVLVLNVVESDTPEAPSVTFGSPSYVVNMDVTQTGVVGQVQATADNGEALTYSLTVDNAHLLERVSVNNEGALLLSAPANSGLYTFQVVATTIITRARATAEVHLTVHVTSIVGDNEIAVPPLIIIDKDEEEEHKNLVVFNTPQTEGCHFTIMNRWPLDQSWLYVDENGLHARSIDREDESIAFMALSQVQVELTLHCESDTAARTKRSQRTDWLGPYDYGLNKWILTQSIPYNSRKSLVNLIVNDINDNAPIFVGKEHEPIAVGYPVLDLVERILPRSLAELKATDADIGENAALLYWSDEDTLAVSPTTGFVHVRNGATVHDNQHLTVSATDRNGQGLTGSIQLLVKLLNTNNIAVVTVNNAFLDDEQSVMAQLSEAVEYELKVLRSIVVSDEQNRANSRNIRDTNVSGASLLLYVYGLIQREVVHVDRLIEDISNNAAVSNVDIVPLEDHPLLPPVDSGGSDTGLLVATIVLSVLLFLIIVLITVWYCLKRRRKGAYKEFSDNKSETSDKDMTSISIENQKPETETTKPRLNIEELKRSEKRLQDMLNAPIETVNIEPTTSREMLTESKIDLLTPETISPIVIQSIDKLKDSEDKDDDEFGERIGARRKSVVTFNENVEKIIHVEDDTDSIKSEHEIHKF